MADIKINGNKYNGIERVKFLGSDGMSAVEFCEASLLDDLISGTKVDVFYNTKVTSVANGNIFKSAKVGVVNMPNVTSIAYQAFLGCAATEIRFEKLQTLPNGSTFLSMHNLKKAVFGTTLSALAQQMFNGCSSLATLVLPYKGVVGIAADALLSTAIAKGNGYVYVPSAYVDSYKANTNWATYANQIRAIEDYPDEVA